MRHLAAAAFGVLLVVATVGCTSSQQERAKEQAREDARKASDEAKRAGREIKKDANELSRKVDAAVESEKTKTAGDQVDHAALVARVKAKLAADAGLSTIANVSVTADGGVVTLSGTIVNDGQKQAAEAAAASVDGVTRVRNELAVQP